MTGRATAFAPTNLALVKYWGKRDAALNLPLADSLSVTLDGLGSVTTVTLGAADREDSLVLDGEPIDGLGLARARRIFDATRALAGTRASVDATSRNSIPTARGLASSASGMAALALATASAFGLDLDEVALSRLARLGSGSASRSVPGGYCRWHAGTRPDGLDSYAESVLAPEHWPLAALAVRVEAGRKAVSSAAGMARSSEASPYFAAWIDTCRRDLEACLPALAARDLAAIAHVVEGNALAMHAAMLATRPPLVYLRGTSLAVADAVQRLRREGAGCFFTIDAGPNVVVFCVPWDATAVEGQLVSIAGVESILRSRVGPGARLLSGEEAT